MAHSFSAADHALLALADITPWLIDALALAGWILEIIVCSWAAAAGFGGVAQ